METRNSEVAPDLDPSPRRTERGNVLQDATGSSLKRGVNEGTFTVGSVLSRFW
jgi:hypothetical protein